MGQQAVPAPVVNLSDSGYATAAQAESAQNKALAAQYGMYGNPNAVAGPMSSIGVGFGSQGQHAENAPAFGVGYGSQGQHAEGNTVSNAGATSQGSAPGASASSAAGPSSGGPGDARGGYLAHEQFDQRPHYALGGTSGHLRPPPAFFQNGKYSFHPAQMYAKGGAPQNEYNLGSYSDGGRLLRGPGDGVSDSIPAVIGQKQPARLADGEFVIPARIVSEIGNGSTEAGARKLYAMMDKVQSARRTTVGKGKVAKNTRADRYLPA
jgi:hypothetical protein